VKEPAIEQIENLLGAAPRSWLVTGVAGFIGSNLAEALLNLGQWVVGLDNFSTGYQRNLDEIREEVGESRWGRFRFIEGDIRDIRTCREATRGVRHVLHQAALGSVPRSLADPSSCHAVNTLGFFNILEAARSDCVESLVYATSSSVYGDDPHLPKREDLIGRPLSPYAATKLINEIYAGVFHRCYDTPCIGLRYFNVFGRRQDPEGVYAAVIPKWISAMIANDPVVIYGDGETSRDFCYIENVVQANILAAIAQSGAFGQAYNIAVGTSTSLNSLFDILVDQLNARGVQYRREPIYKSFRAGDVARSQADISKARENLGYSAPYSIADGLEQAMGWYLNRCGLPRRPAVEEAS
jgi:UDP-N-acetylglucosamine 4-epimerase